MNAIIQVINTVLPVILMLIIGMICRSFNMLSREGINALKSVVVNIALPAVMVNAFATMQYSAKSIILTLMMFAVCVIAWFLGKVLRGIFHMESRFIPFLTTGFEAGMLGYALFTLLYGSDRIADFACIDLGQVLFVFTMYKILLGIDGKEKPTPGQLASEMFHSPTIIAIIAGVLLGATGLYPAMQASGISSILDSCTSFISAPTSAIILLTIGYDLVLGEIPWLAVGKVAAVRIVIMLALRIIAGLFVQAIGMGYLSPALNVMFILPPPYVLPVFADDEKQRSYVSSSLSLTTIITIVGFIVLAAIR